MSFTDFLQDDPQLTREQVMAIAIKVADELDMPDKRGAAVINVMIVDQEVGVENGDPPFERRFWCPANPADPDSYDFPHDSESDDGRSCGYLQQQKGPNGELWWGPTSSEMDPHSAFTTFQTRLKAAGYDASNATAAAASGCAIQNPADHAGYIASCSTFWDDINGLYDAVSSGKVTPPPPANPLLAALQASRPDFNEYWVRSQNSEDRGGTLVDLILFHTEDGSDTDNADGLARFLISTEGTDNPRSYHRTISTGYPHDNGVTVCDVVPTSQAAWAVSASNYRSINMCFAGSESSWDRAAWLEHAGRAIDVGAYLAVRDWITAGHTDAPPVIAPPYNADPPGIADHRYCSVYLQDGNNHTDVDGPNGPYGPPFAHFPWDVLIAAVARYWTLANAAVPAPAPTPPPAPGPRTNTRPTGDAAMRDLLEQLRGPWNPAKVTADGSLGDFAGWPQCGTYPDGSNRSFVDGTMDKLDKLQTALTAVSAYLAKLPSAAPTPTPKPVKKPPAKRTAAKKAPAKGTAMKNEAKGTEGTVSGAGGLGGKVLPRSPAAEKKPAKKAATKKTGKR